MTVEAHKETLGFQAEVQQLLRLVAHSLYSHKEVFLRELISNSSDACDKLRFEALTDNALYESDPDLQIRVSFDKDARTITVADNGIGMDRQEVIDNIGTIARSGTRQFMQKLSGDQTKDANLIGQFGVGFYSSFVVADKVVLLTRRAGMGPEHGVRWESNGEGEYTLETVDKPARGTEVILHLREDDADLLNEWQLRTIITKYSDHITLPVMMPVQKFSEDKDAPPKIEEERINQAAALWARPKQEIKEEEYKEFYKHVSHDFEEPLAWTHNRVEGKLEYTSLLFIPARAPFDLWDREQSHGVKLYVQRVFIMDDAEHLMPRYLRFVRGVIDSNDLPLNISREILQGSKVVDGIRAGSVKKVLSLLEDLAGNDAGKYAKFWKEFGRALKEGPAEDYGNRDQIAKLLRFASTHTDSAEQTVSLSDYLGRMKEGQDKIYYIVADSFAAAKNSPHLEIFRKKGLEVLLLTDRVDEWLMSHLNEFESKSLQSVAKGALDLDQIASEEEKQEQKQAEDQFKELLARVKTVLGDKVNEVRISSRLTDSPACLVVDEHALSAHLERLLRDAGQSVPMSKPYLELNPHHPLITRLKDEPDTGRFGDWTHLLFEQAVLAEGGQLEDPASFVKRLNGLLLTISG
ncbi:molecular chaperone HtpG [Candidatus Contendibacter odensensis]|uniref:Chaperone protein HtpG n=1 Tax=Candidatus Contendobacter odensis Run_B_J11 TaxID=1400861 RepID=A0A7U7GDT1_9GAMM|nr:molecular chaperone HtpG [Candidatus Contendobacter odensis]MBK8751285.1 molecular chaperone HtpG [Candidatus Competibacteraceae bacterium]CDH46228.1 Chaperone protein htpG [Candidatus Contendobacter odensis Run_B_J11]